MADGMCICMGCEEEATVTMCGSCDIPTSKTLYASITAPITGVFALAYMSSAPDPNPCDPSPSPGPGWYYEDASFIVGFSGACGLYLCRKGFGIDVGNGGGTASSCSPLLVVFGGGVLAGTVYE